MPGSPVAERGAFEIIASQSAESAPAIARARTGVTAFIGRTLRGPLHRPVRIASFSDYQRSFGGLWQPSTLSYAIHQFFENGGREALVVRVANGARPPTLHLPGPRGELQLIGLNPGSREYLRAAIDYDGIPPQQSDRFNLNVQRLQMPGSERIEDQEIWRRLSVGEDAGCGIVQALQASRLVRVQGSVPSARPERTLGAGAAVAVGYVACGADGDDGAPLSDYDVIGSAGEHSGLHALSPQERFDLLCIPPLAREQAVGFAALLVALRLCRERHAMLVLDPPAGWNSVETALAGLRSWPLRSADAVMFFPSLLQHDPLRNRLESFGSAAAGAALIARSEESSPVWSPMRADEPILRPGLKPAVAVSDIERARLAQAGVNTLLALRSSARTPLSLRTLASATSDSSDWQHLAARRLALFVVSSIENGTAWLRDVPSGPTVWSRAQAQVAQFLEELSRDGAFASTRSDESYFVICDERLNPPEHLGAPRTDLLFGFALTRPADFHAFRLTQARGVSRVRPIVVNRLSTCRPRVESEIESSILSS